MSGARAPERPERDDAPNVSLSLWLRLIKAHNLVLRTVRARLDPDMTLPQFDVLAQLARKPEGASPATLSRRLLVSPGNLTGIVDRLERRGLVRRDADPGDRRRTRLVLTPAGRVRVRRMVPRHARDLAAALESVPADTQLALRDLLGQFNHSLDGEGEDR